MPTFKKPAIQANNYFNKHNKFALKNNFAPYRHKYLHYWDYSL